MLITSLVLVGSATGVFLIAGAIAALGRLVTQSRVLSLTSGTLAIPALICASLVHWLLTMGADDAPPGMVMIGSLTAVATITPLSLLASHLTNGFLDRCAVRKGS
jgi:hypothetical protein